MEDVRRVDETRGKEATRKGTEEREGSEAGPTSVSMSPGLLPLVGSRLGATPLPGHLPPVGDRAATR